MFLSLRSDFIRERLRVYRNAAIVGQSFVEIVLFHFEFILCATSAFLCVSAVLVSRNFNRGDAENAKVAQS
jgi:hypothetical protein